MKAITAISKRLGFSRSAAVKACTAVLLLALAALLILVQLAVSLLPRAWQKPDLDGATFQISGATKDALKTLDTPVTLTLLSVGGLAEVDEDLYRFLLDYAAASPKITVRVTDPLTDAGFGAAYPALLEDLENMSILVESENRARLISNSDLTYYVSSLFGEKFSYLVYYALCLNYASYSAESLSEFMESTTVYFNGEAQVTNAIRFVSLERTAKLCYVTDSLLDLDWRDRLAFSGYETEECEDLRSLPKDCDVLMLYDLSEDLTPADVKALTAFLDGGGTLFLATSYEERDLPRLEAVLADYGLGFGEEPNLVAENHMHYRYGGTSSSDPCIFLAHIASSHSATGDFDGEFIAYYAHELVLTETDGVTLTSWLKTSELGERKLYDEEGNAVVPETETEAVYTVGAIAERGETTILWLGSTASLSGTVDALADGAGNFDLLIGALHSVSGISAEAIELDAEPISTASLTVSGSDFVLWGILLVLLLPLIVLGIGLVVRQVKRHKQ